MRLVRSLVLLAALGACSSAPQSRVASLSHPLAEHRAPRFRRAAIDGREVNLEEGGRVVVLEFFAKYCKPCERTLPEIEQVHVQRPDVLVIGIAEDDSVEDVHAVVAKHRLTFPVIHDRDNVLSGRFRVRDLPITFVVDGAGVVRWIGDGSARRSDLETAIDGARGLARVVRAES